MHLITISNLRQDATPFPNVQKQLKEWYDIVRTTEWHSLIDVQSIYRDAEAVGNFTIFNINRDYERTGFKYSPPVFQGIGK